MNRRLVPRAPIALITLALLTLASCGEQTDDGDGDVSGQPSGPLDGRTFVATAVTDGGRPHALVEGSELRISFDDGNLGINAGCNHLFGSYVVDGDHLTVDGMGGTDMGCSRPLMDQDAWVSGLFAEPVTFALAGDDLTLTAGDVVVELTDREVVSPDKALEGTLWTLDSLITGDAVSSVPGGVVATLRIEAGRATVDNRCNEVTWDAVVEGDTISFSNEVTTDVDCPGEIAEVQRTIDGVLHGDVGWSIEEKSLTLTNRDTGALGFRAD